MAIAVPAPSGTHFHKQAWTPALLAVLVICMESTNGMGADRTGHWVAHVLASQNSGAIEWLNHVLRKTGHFTGYGMLGLCFSRGWLAMLRRHAAPQWIGLRLRAVACGVASAFVVASCDEIHQVFLPTRGASVRDVLLDTSGALVLGLIAIAVLALRRRRMMRPELDALAA